MTTISPALLDARRRRALWTIVAGVALGSTGHIAAVTVATIVAQDLTGNTGLSGLPGATVVIGAAAGSTLLSALMARRGRRRGLVVGYLVGVLGALVATAAVVFPVLSAAAAGHGAHRLRQHRQPSLALCRRGHGARLEAGDRHRDGGRGSTVGAVVGPNLVAWAGGLATAVGLPVLAGAYLIPIVFVGIAAAMSFALLRPDPYELADRSAPTEFERAAAAPVGEIIRRPAVIISLATLVLGQFVMVLIMNYTPLHMTSHGHGLGTVGLVMSAHTFGMFALSPSRAASRAGWATSRSSCRLARPSHRGSAGGERAAGRRRAAVRGPLPAGLGLGPGLRRRQRDAQRRSARGADAAPGPHRCLRVEHGRRRQHELGIVASVAGYTALGIGGLGLVILLAFVVVSGRQRLVAAA